MEEFAPIFMDTNKYDYKGYVKQALDMKLFSPLWYRSCDDSETLKGPFIRDELTISSMSLPSWDYN